MNWRLEIGVRRSFASHYTLTTGSGIASLCVSLLVQKFLNAPKSLRNLTDAAMLIF